MKRTEIARIFADMEHFDGQDVTVCGWTRTIRDMKNFGFIELNDGSCFKSIQVVFEEGSLENYKEIAKQNVGAALIVQGKVVLTPQAKQPLEIKAASIQVEGPSAPEYPLQKKRHGVEFFTDGGPPAPPDQPLLRSLPGPVCGGLLHSRVLPEPGLCLRAHPPSSPPRTAKAPARCSG